MDHMLSKLHEPKRTEQNFRRGINDPRRLPRLIGLRNHDKGSFCPCYYHGRQNEKYEGIGLKTYTVQAIQYTSP